MSIESPVPFTEIREVRDTDLYSAVEGFHEAYGRFLAVADHYHSQHLADEDNHNPDLRSAQREASIILGLEGQLVCEQFYGAVASTLASRHNKQEKAEMIASLYLYAANKLSLEPEERSKALGQKIHLLEPEYSPEEAPLAKQHRDFASYYFDRITNARSTFGIEVTQDLADQLRTDLCEHVGVDIHTMPDLIAPDPQPNILQRTGRIAGAVGIYGLALTLMAYDQAPGFALNRIRQLF